MNRVTTMAALVIGCLLLLGGCSAADMTALQQTNDQVRAQLADTNKQIVDMRTALEQQKVEAEKITDAAEKAKALDAIKKGEDALSKTLAISQQLETRLGQLDTLLKSVQSGSSQEVAKAVGEIGATIPGAAPYAGVAAVIIGGIFGFLERRKRLNQAATDAAVNQELSTQLADTTSHLANVVKSIELEGPDWTAEQKAAIKALQGPKTTAEVDRLKKELGL